MRIAIGIFAILLSIAFQEPLAAAEVTPYIPPPPDPRESTWGDAVRRLKDYPMQLAKPQLDQLMVRMAKHICNVAAGGAWSESKRQIEPVHRFTPFVLEHIDGFVIRGGTNLASDPIAQMAKTINDSSFILASARMNTWSGAPCLAIQGASFIANYQSGGPNTVMYSIRNMQVILSACAADEGGEFANDSQLLEIAERFNRLFQDTSKLELKQPKEGELALALVESKGNTAAIAWSATGSLEGHWVRVDTTAGELSMDAQNPGRVKLTAIPEKGATLTCYAVSPDGKEWLKSELKVPGPPAK